jgi:hypothetical protein
VWKCCRFKLASSHDIREYYDPYDGRGLGGKNFSRTAALVIDMIHRSKENNIN